MCWWCSRHSLLFLLTLLHVTPSLGFVPAKSRFSNERSAEQRSTRRVVVSSGGNENDENDWVSDFDDFVGDSYDSSNSKDDPFRLTANDLQAAAAAAARKEESVKPSRPKPGAAATDLTGCQSRQFSLGPDLVLVDFVGTMGFDQVTDWEYYYRDEEDEDDDRDRSKKKTTTSRKVVQPNPFDPSQPKRTRTRSGSVVRLFRGELTGLVGGMVASQGLDRRVLVKEFSGESALALAQAELVAIGKLQSDLIKDDKGAVEKGDWLAAAASRSVLRREDSSNVATLLRRLQSACFTGILGEVDLAELEGNMEPNDFYRSLGVPPPKPDARWLVYEYPGLTTLQAYAVPADIRRSKLPPTKGFFGNPLPPPPLPEWRQRASYVVRGLVKGAIKSIATLHEQGLVHRSIGLSSLYLSSSKSMDKREVASPYMTRSEEVVVKLADFGFAAPLHQASLEDEFCVRARSFGLSFSRGDATITTANFAMAEDWHALGFVILRLLLSSLAELPMLERNLPATDEDSLQRLFVDIFDKDLKQLREYLLDEEGVWLNLVALLDEQDGAGWTVLESLLLARENVAKSKGTANDDLLSIRELLASPFFA